jgi:hypothetical protein
MLVEMLFWFHPLVWWVGARLVAERERACDQAVLDTGNAPRIYAEGILKICRFHLTPSPACAAGVSGGNLKARVGAIMSNPRSEDADGGRILLLAGLGMATVMLPLLAGAPGSAPVNHLARQMAASVLQVPPLLAPSIEFITPSVPHVEPPVIRVAQAPSAPPHLEAPVSADRIIAAPAAEKPASVIVTKVSAAPPPLPMDDAMVCRPPQHLTASHLRGPRVCLKTSEWAALHDKGYTVSPDGRRLVAMSNYERDRNLSPTNCAGGLGATQGGGSATTGFTQMRIACF